MSTSLDRAIAAIQDRSNGGWAIEAAQAWAAIAQAEQLKRMADAAERRNVLLEEYNAEAKAAAERHTATAKASISKFLDTVYGDDLPQEDGYGE